MALSTLPHQKILAALRQDDREAVGAVFSQQWRRGIEELQAWIGRTKAPSADKVVAR